MHVISTIEKNLDFHSSFDTGCITVSHNNKLTTNKSKYIILF